MEASLDDNTLRITFSPDRTGAVEILATVNAARLKVTDVSTEEPNLEDVFLNLTDHG